MAQPPRPVLKGHPAMSKRDFDCSSSQADSSPSDTEGAQAAQDTEDDRDDERLKDSSCDVTDVCSSNM